MKILLFLCTIFYVRCKLLLSQNHGQITERISQNLNDTSTTVEILPAALSESKSDDAAAKYFGETIDEENAAVAVQQAPADKNDIVKISNDELLLTDSEKEVPNQRAENTQVDLSETPDEHIVPAIEQKPGVQPETAEQKIDNKPEILSEPKAITEERIQADQKIATENEIATEQLSEIKTGKHIGTKTNIEESIDDKLKTVAGPETPIGQKSNAKCKAVETYTIVEVPEFPVEQKNDESKLVDNVEKETTVAPESKTKTKVNKELETSAETDDPAVEETESVERDADNLEKKSTVFTKFNKELKTTIETGASAKEKSDDIERITDFEETEPEKKRSAVTETADVESEKNYQPDNETDDVESEEIYKSESEEDDEIENKYMSDSSDITIEHIDFVQLRLSHIAKKTTSNITELRLLQAKEFEKNAIYKQGWAYALGLFDAQKKRKIYKGFLAKSAVRTVPDEYHIALIAYTLQYPSMYADFNRKTREVCSGKDVDAYDYQSYFKILLLAIEYIGQEMKFRSQSKFLYRGVTSKFVLEVGQVLAFQHFQSTSSNLMIAEDFAGKTLFEIQGKYDTAVSIRDHSRYRHENEVLFSPFQVYQVESKHEGKYYTRYVLIAHDLPRSIACDLDLRSATPVPQQVRHEGKNGATLKRSLNSVYYAGSNKLTTKSVIRLLYVCAIFTLFVF